MSRVCLQLIVWKATRYLKGKGSQSTPMAAEDEVQLIIQFERYI